MEHVDNNHNFARDPINSMQFKGNYYLNESHPRSHDSETGAHFLYIDMYRRLKILQKQLNISTSYNEDDRDTIPEEDHAMTIIGKYQTSGRKKFLKSLKAKFPRNRYLKTSVDNSRQQLKVVANNKNQISGSILTLESDKINSGEFLNIKRRSVKNPEDNNGIIGPNINQLTSFISEAQIPSNFSKLQKCYKK